LTARPPAPDSAHDQTAPDCSRSARRNFFNFFIFFRNDRRIGPFGTGRSKRFQQEGGLMNIMAKAGNDLMRAAIVTGAGRLTVEGVALPA
jgi:hypothetical protein